MAKKGVHRAPKREIRVDVDTTHSSHRGLLGHYERTLRRFKTLVYLITLVPLYGLAAGLLGVALSPGVYLVFQVYEATLAWPWIARFPTLGWAVGSAFLLYGFSMILLLPVMNWVLVGRLKAMRGPYFSVDFLPWYIHNGLTYLARYTFLELMTPTPFNFWFYQLMGMKVGRGTQINTTNISDPCLIELGEKVTVGGSVTLVAHYGVGGFLVIAPVRIGDRATLGLRSIVMGGVEIGPDAKVLPNSVVLPKTIIGAGETWGGVPAQKIPQKQRKVA